MKYIRRFAWCVYVGVGCGMLGVSVWDWRYYAFCIPLNFLVLWSIKGHVEAHEARQIDTPAPKTIKPGAWMTKSEE